jgi:hypothetical protein
MGSDQSVSAGFDSGSPPPPPPPPGDSCGWGILDATNLPGACWRPYSNSSPWNAPIPDGTPTQADSARLVANLGSPAAGQSKFGDPDLETSNQPVYWSGAGGADPMVTVECTDYGRACPVQGLQVPLPPGAAPAGGYQGAGTYNDANMVVVNATDGKEYDFWRVQSRSGGILRIGWGGYTSATGLGDAASNLGGGSSASGSDLPEYGGTITGDELAANRIPHALRLVVPCAGSHVYPAGKDAGPSCGLDSIPMGTRFQLTMSNAQIDALAVPAWQKAILRAFHTYGAYAADVTGGGAGSKWTLEWSGCDMYESIGNPCRFVQYAKQQGIPPQDFDHDGQLEYQFRWWEGIDWARSVRVVPPPAH